MQRDTAVEATVKEQLFEQASATLPAAMHGFERLQEPLSDREREVLALAAAGLSNSEIAERLILAPGTVKRHLHNIYGKLGVDDRLRAVNRAREIGLI